MRGVIYSRGAVAGLTGIKLYSENKMIIQKLQRVQVSSVSRLTDAVFYSQLFNACYYNSGPVWSNQTHNKPLN